MWTIFPAAAILLAQAQTDPADKWCFERGQGGAKLCESEQSWACNELLEDQHRDSNGSVPKS